MWLKWWHTMEIQGSWPRARGLNKHSCVWDLGVGEGLWTCPLKMSGAYCISKKGGCLEIEPFVIKNAEWSWHGHLRYLAFKRLGRWRWDRGGGADEEGRLLSKSSVIVFYWGKQTKAKKTLLGQILWKAQQHTIHRALQKYNPNPTPALLAYMLPEKTR